MQSGMNTDNYNTCMRRRHSGSVSVRCTIYPSFARKYVAGVRTSVNNKKYLESAGFAEEDLSSDGAWRPERWLPAPGGLRALTTLTTEDFTVLTGELRGHTSGRNTKSTTFTPITSPIWGRIYVHRIGIRRTSVDEIWLARVQLPFEHDSRYETDRIIKQVVSKTGGPWYKFVGVRYFVTKITGSRFYFNVVYLEYLNILEYYFHDNSLLYTSPYPTSYPCMVVGI